MKYTEDGWNRRSLLKHTHLIRPLLTWQCCKCDRYIVREPVWKGKYRWDGARWYVCTTCAPTLEAAINTILTHDRGAYL